MGGEAKRKGDIAAALGPAMVDGGLVLEPKGAPQPARVMIDLRAGVHQEALQVVVQYGDAYALIEPEEAEEIAKGLIICAQHVRRLRLAKQHHGPLAT